MSSTKKRNFSTVLQADVPRGRNGKHRQIVKDILEQLAELKDGAALKVPLKEIDAKEKIRSALNRASRKAKIVTATAADSEFLYIWNAKDAG